MEKLSKILLVCLIICLIIIGGYFVHLFNIQQKIEKTDNHCKESICKVGTEDITGYHYSPQYLICHCFTGNQVASYQELDWNNRYIYK
jgi:hypothetical protein